MSDFLLALIILLLAFWAFRAYWLYASHERVCTADFPCKLYHVGETAIAVREGDPDTDRSIICFPGFLMDMRYFMELYKEEDCQLILVNNATYHVPVDSDDTEVLDWEQNPFPVGDIEHDAFYLAKVIQHLATGSQVVLHGHSRGAAVILEAGRQFPAVTRTEGRYIRAILEAPVLPGGRFAGRGSDALPFALTILFMPIVLGLGRRAGPEQLLKQPMMHPATPLKTEYCGGIYFHPKSYRICPVNWRGIRNWQRDTGVAVYDNYERIDIVIGERDDVLDNDSMIASAETAEFRNEGANMLRTEGTNHFPSLERPELITSLL